MLGLAVAVLRCRGHRWRPRQRPQLRSSSACRNNRRTGSVATVGTVVAAAAVVACR